MGMLFNLLAAKDPYANIAWALNPARFPLANVYTAFEVLSYSKDSLIININRIVSPVIRFTYPKTLKSGARVKLNLNYTFSNSGGMTAKHFMTSDTTGSAGALWFVFGSSSYNPTQGADVQSNELAITKDCSYLTFAANSASSLTVGDTITFSKLTLEIL